MSKNLRTIKKYNLDILSSVGFGTFEMPELFKEETIPEKITGFNYALSKKQYDSFVHFYLDDYQFERVWAYPNRYLEMFKKFDGIFTPDFSLYADMPLPVQIYNTYRSRVLGKYYQESGIKVIPTVSWSDEKSFDFCFEGLPENGVVTISTVGVKKQKSNNQLFKVGFEEMIRRIKPKTVLIYGDKIDTDFKNVVYFKNENIERVRSNGR